MEGGNHVIGQLEGKEGMRRGVKRTTRLVYVLVVGILIGAGALVAARVLARGGGRASATLASANRGLALPVGPPVPTGPKLAPPGSPASTLSARARLGTNPYRAGVVLVGFRSGVSDAQRATIVRAVGA